MFTLDIHRLIATRHYLLQFVIIAMSKQSSTMGEGTSVRFPLPIAPPFSHAVDDSIVSFFFSLLPSDEKLVSNGQERAYVHQMARKLKNRG